MGRGSERRDVISRRAERLIVASENKGAVAKTTGDVTQALGDGTKLYYTLEFPYEDGVKARVIVSENDYLIRRVSLFRSGDLILSEAHSDIQVDKPIPTEAFSKSVPEGARVVATIPPLEDALRTSTDAAGVDFSLQTVDGRTIKMSDLKGKIVLINFYFVH